MFPQTRPLTPLVPYTFPPISFLKLQDYVTTLLANYGGVFWPLDDPASNPYARVINTAVAKGRQLVLVPDFATDTVWSKSAGCTIAGGVGVFTAATAGAGFTQTIPMVVGRAYEVIFDLVVTSGTMRVNLGGGGLGTTRSASATYTENVICATDTLLRAVAVTTFTGTIDNISIKELNIPASNAAPVQLLNTGVWNNLGIGAWTAVSATLTAQTTTRHDGASGTILRIAGAAGAVGEQLSIFTLGIPYRVYGWCRSDGVLVPRVYGGNNANQFQGTTSTAWQPFDFVTIPLITSTFALQGSVGASGYVEFDVTVVALDTGIRTDSPGVDLDMENNDVLSWTSINSGTITKDITAPHSGVRNLRLARNGTNNPQAREACLCTGKTYSVSVWVKGDGSAVPSVNFGASASGTATATWQKITAVGVASSANLALIATTSTGTQFCEFDDVTIFEISPLVGLPVNGVISGNVESNRLLNSYSFDGVNDLVNLYSGQLNSIFPTDEGTLIAFAKVNASGNWTDGLTKDIALLESDANNFVLLQKTTVNNQLAGWYAANSVRKSILDTSLAGSLNWFCVAVSWSKFADQVKFYINGVQVGSTQTGLGTWVGNLLSIANVLGAGTSTGTNLWAGKESPIVLLDTPLSASEVAEIAKLGDTF